MWRSLQVFEKEILVNTSNLCSPLRLVVFLSLFSFCPACKIRGFRPHALSLPVLATQRPVERGIAQLSRQGRRPRPQCLLSIFLVQGSREGRPIHKCGSIRADAFKVTGKDQRKDPRTSPKSDTARRGLIMWGRRSLSGLQEALKNLEGFDEL